MLEWWFDNQWSKDEMSTINFKAIGLLEVQNPSSMVHVLVSRLESTRGPRKNGEGEKLSQYQELSRRGEILTTFLT